jgi:hypothetical protein
MMSLAKGLQTLNAVIIRLGSFVVDLIGRLTANTAKLFNPPLALMLISFQHLATNGRPIRRKSVTAI